MVNSHQNFKTEGDVGEEGGSEMRHSFLTGIWGVPISKQSVLLAGY